MAEVKYWRYGVKHQLNQSIHACVYVEVIFKEIEIHQFYTFFSNIYLISSLGIRGGGGAVNLKFFFPFPLQRQKKNLVKNWPG